MKKLATAFMLLTLFVSCSLDKNEVVDYTAQNEQEIKDYIAKPENKKNLEEVYTENFAKYNQAEEVKARHILIQGDDKKAEEKIKAIKAKVNTKNFGEIAKKETEDPTGKPNGGELGWFSTGRMVPEFDKVAFAMKKGEISAPVKTQFGWHIIYVEDKKAAQVKTLETVQNELAQMAIQKTKAQDLDNLLKQEQERLTGVLNKNDTAGLEAAEKKVGAQIFKNTEVNQFDQAIGQLTLSPKEAEQVFKAEAGTVINLGNPGTIYLVKVVSKRQGEDTDKKITEQLKNEVTSQNQAFSRKTREELLKTMNNKAKVVTNPSLL
jgi:peptidyl-prolyl cis-trans isomerase D